MDNNKERRAHPRHDLETPAELTVESPDKPASQRRISDLVADLREPVEPEEAEAAAVESAEEQAQAAEAAEDESADSGDQRSHARKKVAYEINVEAGLRIGGHEVMRLKLLGTTVDISRGGMLIHVDQEVLPGARCNVRFLESEGQIEPEETAGRVRRSVKARKGFHLAVQFDEPLDKLEA